MRAIIAIVLTVYFINASLSASTSDLLCSYCKSAFNDLRAGAGIPEESLISFSDDFYEAALDSKTSEEVRISYNINYLKKKCEISILNVFNYYRLLILISKIENSLLKYRIRLNELINPKLHFNIYLKLNALIHSILLNNLIK